MSSGWYGGLIQHKAYVDFATNAPGYGQLQNDTVLQQINQAFYGPGGCKEQVEACHAAGNSDASNKICDTASRFCVRYNVNQYRDTMFKKKNSRKHTYPLLQLEIATNTISGKIHQILTTFLLRSTSTSLPKQKSNRK